MSYEQMIFVPVYTIVVAFSLYLSYYIGRKSRSEDLEYICNTLTEGTQPKHMKVPRSRAGVRSIMKDLPQMYLDPVVPDEEPYSRKRKEGTE